MARQKSKDAATATGAPKQKLVPGIQSEPNRAFNDNDDSYPNLLKDQYEEELEGLVFGKDAKFMAQLEKTMDLDVPEVENAILFFLDSGPAVDSVALIPSNPTEKEGDAPAWEDSDDERLAVSLAGNTRLRKLRVNEDEDIVSGSEYIRRLRRQYERLNPAPPWAHESTRPAKRQRRSSASSDTSISSNDEDQLESMVKPLTAFLQSANSFTPTTVSPTKRVKLRPEILDIQQTRPIPTTQPCAVSSLSFHPEWPILLSSGLASTLYLHHIDPIAYPVPNPLVTSVYVKNTPLHSSNFLPEKGKKIIFSGRRKYFHIWDLESGNIEKVTRIYGHQDEQRTMEVFKLSPCGRYMALVGSSKKGGGVINILCANTMQWIASMRIEGAQGIADFAWWRDGEGITVVSKSSEVAEWSIVERAYVARWIDDGYAPTVLALGASGGPKALGSDRWVAIGSQSGIVNIYDRRTFVDASNPTVLKIPERPQPKKSFGQLTKPISHLVISPDGQLLSFSSRWKKDALRLVHLPSCTVYRNWPTDRTPLGRITAVAFGNGCDLLAVGNEAGRIHMWEIRS
ncbi:putative U3 small nucleolar RNA-associated protein 18 [Podosphaera aphanis]|nr:putative U3 small nucleolar RNA-associated protein 18 [Podosphaera aphanis]